MWSSVRRSLCVDEGCVSGAWWWCVCVCVRKAEEKGRVEGKGGADFWGSLDMAGQTE